MSLDTLSGELILIITDYLSEHPGALPTLCLVLKRVRKFAELSLYKHIVLRGDGKFRATKLLMTLVERNDLALRATTVDAQEETYERVKPHIKRNLAVHEAAIRQLIANLLSVASRDSQLLTDQQQWCLDTTAPRPGDTNSSTIALILCMVINVNRTRLSYQHDSFGCLALGLLATSWKDVETRPFRHLESVIIQGMASFKSTKAPLPSSMKSLGFDEDSISVHPFIFPIPPHTLELKRVINLTPNLLHNILSCEYLVGLKVLIVEREIPDGNPAFPERDLNMGLLIKALARHTPLLERFTWTNRQPSQWYMSPDNKFGSFKPLSQLKHLHVERGNFTNDHLFSYATICALQRNIPEGLQTLTIADYPKVLVRGPGMATSPILRTSHKTTDLTQALSSGTSHCQFAWKATVTMAENCMTWTPMKLSCCDTWLTNWPSPNSSLRCTGGYQGHLGMATDSWSDLDGPHRYHTRVSPTRLSVHSPDTYADNTARTWRRKTFVSGTCKFPRLLGAQGGWRERERES
jgi:hypothetical protein